MYMCVKVMYMCVGGIDFISVSTIFLLGPSYTNHFIWKWIALATTTTISLFASKESCKMKYHTVETNPNPSHECERSCICVLRSCICVLRSCICVLRSCICVLVVSILSLFLRFFYWGLDLFRRCGDISIHGLLLQWASTIKNTIKRFGLVQSGPHHHII
jgi:hypothetical protein